MSYQVLARKWRPQQFKDMIGQDHVVRALTNALDNNRLHHAYLFTGMRGVGKTTIARVFAKSLNCETRGVSSEPCGECSTCRDIEAGRFFDLIEVDAASRTKVEDTRELLENVPYAPASGRFKVYLIDEVHMFSGHSFNALLKTLEEPPEHVKFILATTDPQKVPVTILSRCLQFNLKSVPNAVLTEYLGTVLDAEGITWEPAALEHIAKASEGSVRDALSLVEQSAAFGGGSVRASEVESMLGRMSPERLLDLLDAVAALNGPGVIQQVESLAEYAPDYAQLLSELLSALHSIALQQTIDGTAATLGVSGPRIAALAKVLSPADVQLFFQIGLHGRRDMPFAPDQRASLEMTLLRMVAFKPAAAGHSVPVESPPATAQKGVAPPATAQKGVAPPATVATTVHAAKAASVPITEPASASASVPTVTNIEWIADNWRSLVEQLQLSGMPGQLAHHCSFESLTNDVLKLTLETQYEQLNNPGFVTSFQAAVSTARGHKTELVIALETTPQNTPARQQARQAHDALAAAKSSIRQDPLVQTLLDKVGGVVDESSVKPIE